MARDLTALAHRYRFGPMSGTMLSSVDPVHQAWSCWCADALLARRLLESVPECASRPVDGQEITAEEE